MRHKNLQSLECDEISQPEAELKAKMVLHKFLKDVAVRSKHEYRTKVIIVIEKIDKIVLALHVFIIKWAFFSPK